MHRCLPKINPWGQFHEDTAGHFNPESIECEVTQVRSEGDLTQIWIEVYQKFEDGWWYGGVGGRKGYFPSNCVEVGVRGDDVPDTPNAFDEDGSKQDSARGGPRTKLCHSHA